MRTDFQNVLVEQDENVVTLTMNRPDMLNAINTLVLKDCPATQFVQPTLFPTLAGYTYFNAQHSS